jgi:hypothetical protein
MHPEDVRLVLLALQSVKLVLVGDYRGVTTVG